MEFRLIYRGKLPAEASGKGGKRTDEKHAIRKEFHKQLATLWKENHILSQWSIKSIRKIITLTQGAPRGYLPVTRVYRHDANASPES